MGDTCLISCHQLDVMKAMEQEASTSFLAQLTEIHLKDKCTALHSIQNDGNAFHIY